MHFSSGLIVVVFVVVVVVAVVVVSGGSINSPALLLRGDLRPKRKFWTRLALFLRQDDLPDESFHASPFAVAKL